MSRRWSRPAACARGDQVLECLRGRRVVRPCHRAAGTGLNATDEWLELLIVNQERDVLSHADIVQLWTGEIGVEVQQPCPELGGGKADVDEAAVISAQDADTVAGPDPTVSQGARQGVRAIFQLTEGESPSSSTRPTASGLRIAATVTAAPSWPRRLSALSASNVCSRRSGAEHPGTDHRAEREALNHSPPSKRSRGGCGAEREVPRVGRIGHDADSR